MSPSTAVRPNILFIMADDLGYADVSCYGRRDYETPAIDRLAREGLRFTQAYANSAVCSATRTGLMTGRYQYRLPVGLEEPISGRDVGLPPDHPTLPSLLRDAGYGTALVGKWHLGNLPRFCPLKSGYDHFWGFRGGAVDYFTHKMSGERDLWDGETPIAAQGYLTDLLGDRCIDAIDGYADADKPFFISLHFNAPHWPWEGPDDHAESARLDEDGSIPAMLHFDGGTQHIYAQMVMRMDMQIGRIIDHLEARGMTRNTIIIFTSDNGGERFSDTWPFTGKKTELLEGGLRIPAIIRWPARIAPGAVSEQVMISMDWLPTLLCAAGAAPHPDFLPDGLNLMPMLDMPDRITQRLLCWRYKNMDQQACRQGDWKYLKILDNEFLFNVVEDPLERANLKRRRPEIFGQLKAYWTQWNAQMLALDPRSYSHGLTGEMLADHFGARLYSSVDTPAALGAPSSD